MSLLGVQIKWLVRSYRQSGERRESYHRCDFWVANDGYECAHGGKTSFPIPKLVKTNTDVPSLWMVTGQPSSFELFEMVYCLEQPSPRQHFDHDMSQKGWALKLLQKGGAASQSKALLRSTMLNSPNLFGRSVQGFLPFGGDGTGDNHGFIHLHGRIKLFASRLSHIGESIVPRGETRD
jgi:hypothetical protein